MSKPYAIITGDLTPGGGMDRPNYELAWYLAERARAEVHLVSHRVAHPLSAHTNVTWHRVPRPFGRHALGSPLLCRRGRQVAEKIVRAGGSVIVNGGNCLWNDINWVHYVHNILSEGKTRGNLLQRQWSHWNQSRDRRRERLILGMARLVITNSNLTKNQLISGVSINPGLARTIYLGVDPEVFHPSDGVARVDARRSLGLPMDRPLVAFVGALSLDRRKGFDVLFDAWCRCLAEGGWDAVLVVAGIGPELAYWRKRVTESGREQDIRMLGYMKDIPTLLAAADALVSPTRFEPYGYGVHEAICCGLPAFVTRCAGIAERFPAELQDLLLDDPPDSSQLSARLKEWHRDIDGYRRRVLPFSEQLRRRTWSDMAADLVEAMTEADQPATLSGARITT